MSSTARDGNFVSVHYTGKLEDGTVFDSSRDGEPLEFQLGAGTVIRGFEAAVEGMEVGQHREVTIPPAEAYGDRREDLELDVSRDELPEDVPAEVGSLLAVQVAPGQQMVARITDVEADAVTLDLNHPLAGQSLTFDIELMGVK